MFHPLYLSSGSFDSIPGIDSWPYSLLTMILSHPLFCCILTAIPLMIPPYISDLGTILRTAIWDFDVKVLTSLSVLSVKNGEIS